MEMGCLKAGCLLSIAFFSLGVLGQPYYDDPLIGERDSGASANMIDGLDDYEVDKYSGFDRSIRPQRQVEEQRPAPPYWYFYRSDYDSYQEQQTEELMQWQRRIGIRPPGY